MEVDRACGSRRKLRFIIGSLLLLLNIVYINITSEGERWARGEVVGLEVSEKLERHGGKDRQQKVCRHSWKKME